MAAAITQTSYRALLLLDPHFRASVINFDDSDLTQAGPLPGVPIDVSETPSRMVLEAPGGSQPADSVESILCMRGGFPGRSQRSAGFVTQDDEEDYRGWWPPNLVSGWNWPPEWRGQTASGLHYKHPCLIRTRSGKVLAAVAGDETIGSFITISELQANGTWEDLTEIASDDEFPGANFQHQAMCETADGILCLFHWVADAGAGALQIQSWQSKDDGETWALVNRYALDTPVDSGVYTSKRLRAAYSRGQILLVAQINDPSPPSSEGEALIQFASDDDGATFTTVYTFDLTDDECGAVPDILVTAAGNFQVLYINTALLQLNSRTIGTAFHSLGDVDEVNLDDNSTVPDSLDTSVLAAWTGEEGIWYLFAIFGSSQRNGLVMRSVDEGATWARMESGSGNSLVDGAWMPGTDEVRFADMAATEFRGRTVMVAEFESDNTSNDYLDRSLAAVYFGGHSSVSMPYAQLTSTDASSLAWLTSWIGIEVPHNYGSNFPETTAGTPTTTLTDDGMEISTTSGGGDTDSWIYDLPNTVDTDVEHIVLVELSCESGGSRSTNQVACRVRAADGTDDYEVAVRCDTTGFTIRDVNGSVNVGAVDHDMTDPVQILIAVGDGQVAIYYRTSGGPGTPDRLWTVGPQGTLASDTGSPAASGEVQFGHIVASTSRSVWRMMMVAVGKLTGSVALADGQSNPDDLHPRPFAVNPITLPSGVRLRAKNGPAVAGEAWEVRTRYTHGIELTDPTVSPDPRRKWRSRNTNTVTVIYDVSPIAGTNIAPSSPSYGVCVLGFNGKWCDFQGYDVDTGTWVTIAGVGVHGQSDPLSFTREGDTLRVSAASTTQDPQYFSKNALRGAHIEMAGGGGGATYRHCRSNSHGYWDETKTTLWPTIQIDADGTEPTSGTIKIGWGDFVLIGHDVTRFSRLRVKLYHHAEESRVEAGVIMAGPVILFGRDYSHGRIVTTEVDTDLNTRRGGGRDAHNNAPERRTLAFAWSEHVDEKQLDNDGVAPDYITAEGVPSGIRNDIGRLLEGIIRETKGPLVPVVYLPNVPSDGTSDKVAITPLDGFVYGRIVGPIRREMVRGTEGVDELVRVSTVVIEEEVGYPPEIPARSLE